MPEKTKKKLEFVKSVRWVEKYRTMEERICGKVLSLECKRERERES